MSLPPIVTGYFDMDGPLADCEGGFGIPVGHPKRGLWETDKKILAPMYKEGFFRNLQVTEGAVEAVAQIMNIPRLDFYIATHPIVEPLAVCASEKYEWIREHFPDLLHKMFMTCDKGHLNGHYLIDDHKEGWEAKFKGTFLHFDVTNPMKSWQDMICYLEKYDPNTLPNQVKEVEKYPAMFRTQMSQSGAFGSGNLMLQMQIKVGDRYVKLMTFDVTEPRPHLIHNKDCLGLRDVRSFDLDMASAQNHQGDWKPFEFWGDIEKIEVPKEILNRMTFLRELSPSMHNSHVGNH